MTALGPNPLGESLPPTDRLNLETDRTKEAQVISNAEKFLEQNNSWDLMDEECGSMNNFSVTVLEPLTNKVKLDVHNRVKEDFVYNATVTNRNSQTSNSNQMGKFLQHSIFNKKRRSNTLEAH